MKVLASHAARGLKDLTALLSDTVDLVDPGFVVCKGVAGNVAVIDYMGNTSIYPIGLNETLPVIITRVKSTGTTATGLWLYVR